MSKRLCSLLVLGVALLSILGTLFPSVINMSMTTHAVHPLVDPQVAIAIDATDHSCFKKTAKTLRALTTAKPTPCPAGTLMESMFVPLSIARTHHEAYVPLPSTSASQSLWEQTDNQIHRLLVAKRNMLQHIDKGEKVVPHNDCGSFNEIGTYPNVAGDSLYVDIDYQISYSCANLVLDQTKVYGLTSPTELYWWEWLYASDSQRFGPPDCRFVGTNHYVYPINRVDPIGYNFVWEFAYPYCIGKSQSVSVGSLV